jgi:hypothetical protein
MAAVSSKQGSMLTTAASLCACKERASIVSLGLLQFDCYCIKLLMHDVMMNQDPASTPCHRMLASTTITHIQAIQLPPCHSAMYIHA